MVHSPAKPACSTKKPQVDKVEHRISKVFLTPWFGAAQRFGSGADLHASAWQPAHGTQRGQRRDGGSVGGTPPDLDGDTHEIDILRYEGFLD